MMKTLYASSLYLLITCLAFVNGSPNDKLNFKIMSTEFNGYCVAPDAIQAGSPLGITKCENAPFFMIALDILGTIQVVENPDLCVDVVNNSPVINNCNGGNTQQLFFAAGGEIIAEGISMTLCVGNGGDPVTNSGAKLRTARCSRDPTLQWFTVS